MFDFTPILSLTLGTVFSLLLLYLYKTILYSLAQSIELCLEMRGSELLLNFFNETLSTAEVKNGKFVPVFF